MASPYDYEKKDLTGKVIIVTGANAGIGYEATKELIRMNAKVYLACRNKEKAEAAIENIKKEVVDAQAVFLPLDLSSFDSVKKFVELFKEKEDKLDILINNAGLINVNGEFTLDGFELTTQANYLSTVLLTYLLIPLLEKSASSRIVNVSSKAHEYAAFDLSLLEKDASKSISPSFSLYGKSKLFLTAFTKELADHLKDKNILAVSTHPGVIATDFLNKESYKSWYYDWITKPFFSALNWFFYITLEEGSATTLHAAIDPSVVNSGDYYDICKPAKANAAVYNSSLRKELWDKTFEVLNISPEL